MGATQSLDFLICIASGVGLGAQKVPSYTIVQGAWGMVGAHVRDWAYGEGHTAWSHYTWRENVQEITWLCLGCGLSGY